MPQIFHSLLWRVVGILTCSLLSSAVFAQERVGELADVALETSHPYPAGMADTSVVWSYTLRHPGATFLKVHFAAKRKGVRNLYLGALADSY